MTERWHLWVSGRVQGVFYRGSTQRQAQSLGLSGWARNLADGRVEIVAEGQPETLQQLFDWCHKGPPAARVTAVEKAVETATGEFADFGVRPSA